MNRPVPDPPDQEDWDKAATTALIGQLDAVRAQAEKWSATVTALLGILSSVAIVAGVGAISDLPANWRWPAVAVVVVAGLLAAASIGTSSKAAGSTFAPTENFDGNALRAHISNSTQTAIDWLAMSRWTGFAAAALVFVAGVLGLVAATLDAPSASTYILVVDDTGSIRCVELITDANGSVTLGGGKAVQVQIVDRC